MNNIAKRLGFDPRELIHNLSFPIQVTVQPPVAPQPVQPAPAPKPRQPKPTKYKSITRRLLPVHTSPTTLPKTGTIRPDDGYVFFSGYKRKDQTVWRELWYSPSYVARRKAKFKAAHPGVVNNQIHPVTRKKPTKYKRGDIGPDGRVFFRYSPYQYKNGTVVWHQKWYNADTDTGLKILAQKRSK